jgi:hypothetical protein
VVSTSAEKEYIHEENSAAYSLIFFHQSLSHGMHMASDIFSVYTTWSGSVEESAMEIVSRSVTCKMFPIWSTNVSVITTNMISKII